MSYAVAEDEAEDRYYTQVEAGDVRLFTLDQLDAAFNAGLIHENTYVCLEGSEQWLTLGEVAGLGEEEPPAPSVAPPPYHGVAASRSVVAGYDYAPLAPSIAPMVSDLSWSDLDAELQSMRPKRRLGKVVAGLAVLSLGGLGFLAVHSGGLRGLKLPNLDPTAARAAAASLSLSSVKDDAATPTPRQEVALPAAPVAAPAVVATPAPEPVKPVEAVKAAEPQADERFSDEMKAALLKKDAKQASAQKAKKAARAAAPAKRKLAKSAKLSRGFKSGGSAYDPLNGKL